MNMAIFIQRGHFATCIPLFLWKKAINFACRFFLSIVEDKVHFSTYLAMFSPKDWEKGWLLSSCHEDILQA